MDVRNAGGAVGDAQAGGGAVGDVQAAGVAVGDVQAAGVAVGDVQAAGVAVGDAQAAGVAVGDALSGGVVGDAMSGGVVGNVQGRIVGDADAAGGTGLQDGSDLQSDQVAHTTNGEANSTDETHVDVNGKEVADNEGRVGTENGRKGKDPATTKKHSSGNNKSKRKLVNTSHNAQVAKHQKAKKSKTSHNLKDIGREIVDELLDEAKESVENRSEQVRQGREQETRRRQARVGTAEPRDRTHSTHTDRRRRGRSPGNDHQTRYQWHRREIKQTEDKSQSDEAQLLANLRRGNTKDEALLLLWRVGSIRAEKEGMQFVACDGAKLSENLVNSFLAAEPATLQSRYELSGQNIQQIIRSCRQEGKAQSKESWDLINKMVNIQTKLAEQKQESDKQSEIDTTSTSKAKQGEEVTEYKSEGDFGDFTKRMGGQRSSPVGGFGANHGWFGRGRGQGRGNFGGRGRRGYGQRR